MRPVPRLPPKVLSSNFAAELDMPVPDEIECGAFLQRLAYAGIDGNWNGSALAVPRRDII
jgi:hypothetical protein